MECTIVALIIDAEENILGYKAVCNVGNFTYRDGYFVMDYDQRGLMEAISNRENTFYNVGIQDGKIVGINGALNRLPKLIDGMLFGNSALTVLGDFDDGSYLVSDYKGMIKRLSYVNVLKYAKINGISNGKIVERDGKYLISSLAGSYKKLLIKQSMNRKEQLRLFQDKQDIVGKIFDIDEAADRRISISKYYDDAARDTVIIPDFVNEFSLQPGTASIVGGIIRLGNGAFHQCLNIRKVISRSRISGSLCRLFDNIVTDVLDLSEFDTSNVVNMREMFAGARIGKLILGGKFITSNVSDMTGMFSCSEIGDIDYKDFDTTNVVLMDFMFTGAKFSCNLDLKSFDTHGVSSFERMMYNTNVAGIMDLSSFDTRNSHYLSSMFSHAVADKIILGDNFVVAERNSMLFYQCETIELVLGRGFTVKKEVDAFDKARIQRIVYKGGTWQKLMLMKQRSAKGIIKQKMEE